MKLEYVLTSDRVKLQNQLTKITNSLTSRFVSCSIQAHSSELGTIVVSVSGMHSVIQRVFVIVRKYNEDLQRDDWYLYCNGRKFSGADITQVFPVISKEVTRTAQQLESFR